MSIDLKAPRALQDLRVELNLDFLAIQEINLKEKEAQRIAREFSKHTSKNAHWSMFFWNSIITKVKGSGVGIFVLERLLPICLPDTY
jgi:hypothetical protein